MKMKNYGIQNWNKTMQIKKAYNTTEINAMQMEILQNTNKNYTI